MVTLHPSFCKLFMLYNLKLKRTVPSLSGSVSPSSAFCLGQGFGLPVGPDPPWCRSVWHLQSHAHSPGPTHGRLPQLHAPVSTVPGHPALCGAGTAGGAPAGAHAALLPAPSGWRTTCLPGLGGLLASCCRGKENGLFHGALSLRSLTACQVPCFS